MHDLAKNACERAGRAEKRESANPCNAGSALLSAKAPAALDADHQASGEAGAKTDSGRRQLASLFVEARIKATPPDQSTRKQLRPSQPSMPSRTTAVSDLR